MLRASPLLSDALELRFCICLRTPHSAPPAAQGFETRLPLSWYDDTEFETRPAHEWVASCRKANRRADGLALVMQPTGTSGTPGSGTWRYMKVLKFSTDANRYLITAMDENGTMHAKPYLEDRINMYFSDEKMGTFAARVASAHSRRAEAEEQLLRQYYIANMPVSDLRQISAQQVSLHPWPSRIPTAGIMAVEAAATHGPASAAPFVPPGLLCIGCCPRSNLCLICHCPACLPIFPARPPVLSPRR